jgi:hypothetical protein
MKRVNRCCSYALAIDAGVTEGELQSVAHYLSTLASAECEVLVIDDCSPDRFEERHRVLRWVGRHVAAQPHHRLGSGEVDLIRAAVELSGCDKVIVAATDARYTAAEVQSICELLERHEVVEPEEYFEPLPWWGGLDAGRILLHRGVDQSPESRSTFAFRRAAYHPMRGFDSRLGGNHIRRLVMYGAEVYEAHGVFVRREPLRFPSWLRLRPREASADLETPFKSAFFLALAPLLLTVAILGGMKMAGGYAAIIAFPTLMLAARGRAGAGRFFPLRACLFAPLWVVEHSISVYWALFERLRGGHGRALALSLEKASQRAASGE